MKRFFSCGLLCSALAFLSLSAGCGAGGKGGSGPAGSYGPPAPAAYGSDRYRPNYGGDLTGSLFWEEPAIRYRVMDTDPAKLAEDPDRARATDVRGATILQTAPSQAQRDAIRDAFLKWNVALSGEKVSGDPSQQADPGNFETVPQAGRRVFVEALPGEPAQIDVVVQTRPAFMEKRGNFTEEYGETGFYVKDVDAGKLGRCVIRLRNDLDPRRFAYTALHEKGHAQGFFGHDRRFLKLMYPIQSPVTPLVELDRVDVNTVRALYVGRSTEATPGRARSAPVRTAYYD